MPTVLAVVNEVRLRELLYDALTHNGYAVSTAGSGEQALEMLKAQHPQLVLLDVTLPKLSGLELAQRIRAFDAELPIILWQGADESTIAAEELKRLAIEEVMYKEWDMARVLERLEQTLKRHSRKAGSATATTGSGLTGTLLVVDDDPKVQNLLKTFFELKGLHVLLAGSGEEALQALARHPVLVLLDVNMPGMDGVMALKKIKVTQPRLPVVMMSGGGEEALARAGLEAGAYDYVSKPFNLEYLETVVLTKVLLGLEG